MLFAKPSIRKAQFLEYFKKKENELCQGQRNHKKTHFHDHKENVHIVVLLIFRLHKTLF